MTCSVNIITGSSEKTLKQCLDSINQAGCFGEIVIAVDDRANDETIQIIADHQGMTPLKAFSFHWGKDGFSGPRNATLENSTGRYIFWLDSDETVELAICDLIRQADGSAYYIHQISELPDGNVIDVPQIRLFPNIPGVKWELPIHEQIMFSLEKLKIPMIDTEIIVHHNGYDTNEKIRDKHLRNFPYLQDYVTTQRNDRKMQYVKDRYNESLSYLESNGLLGNLGIIGVIIMTIVSTVITLLPTGLSIKDSIDTAMKQARMQRAMTQAEISQFAELMHQHFPEISYEDWRNYANLAMLTYVPPPPDDIPIPTPKNNEWEKYLPYGVVFLALMMVMRK